MFSTEFQSRLSLSRSFALSKPIVNRSCRDCRLPGRNGDLIESFDDVTGGIETIQGRHLMLISQKAAQFGKACADRTD